MADQDEQSPIVVGVDGSSCADDALDWAAVEASVMHRPLRIVHGFISPLMRVPSACPNSDPPTVDSKRRQGEQLHRLAPGGVAHIVARKRVSLTGPGTEPAVMMIVAPPPNSPSESPVGRPA